MGKLVASLGFLWAYFAVSASAFAGQTSLISSQGFFQARDALVPVAVQSTSGLPDRATGSLFSGRSGGSLFAPIVRAEPEKNASIEPLRGAGVIGLRNIIASAEAGKAGYDAVVWSAKIKTPKPPTQMTLGEVFAWIKATPNQNHAIGRYQFIPPTLARVVNIVGAGPNDMFSPEMQDRLADVLLEDAGLSKFKAGTLGKTAFMNNLAKIWAGLPNSSGRSHYHGYAGNKATMTWASFKTRMARAFPS